MAHFALILSTVLMLIFNCPLETSSYHIFDPPAASITVKVNEDKYVSKHEFGTERIELIHGRYVTAERNHIFLEVEQKPFSDPAEYVVSVFVQNDGARYIAIGLSAVDPATKAAVGYINAACKYHCPLDEKENNVLFVWTSPKDSKGISVSFKADIVLYRKDYY